MDEQITFDEYCKKNQHSRSCTRLEAFSMGQKSRQTEIDRLQTENQLLKDTAESDMKTIERLESVIDQNDFRSKEKDKRIEAVLELLEFPTASWEEVVFQAVEALRGERE